MGYMFSDITDLFPFTLRRCYSMYTKSTSDIATHMSPAAQAMQLMSALVVKLFMQIQMVAKVRFSSLCHDLKYRLAFI